MPALSPHQPSTGPMGLAWTTWWRSQSARARRRKFLSLIHRHDLPAEARSPALKTLLVLGLEPPSDVSWQSQLDASLHRSIADSQPALIVQCLLEAGANPDARWQFKSAETALMTAVRKGSLDHVDCLLIAGANPNLIDMNCVSALSLAIHVGSLPIFKRLLDSKVRPSADTPCGTSDLLAAAATASDRSWLELLFGAGVHPTTRDDEGRSLMHAVAGFRVSGNPLPPGIIRFLVEQGLDVNDATKTGQRPLHVALTHHNLEAAFQLLEAGADPGLPDTSQRQWQTSAHLLVMRNLPNSPGVGPLLDLFPEACWSWRNATGQTPYEQLVEVSLSDPLDSDSTRSWMALIDFRTLQAATRPSEASAPTRSTLRL